MVLSGLLIIASVAISIYGWYALPNTIPTHFNFSGQPDAWGDKSVFTIFFVPTLQIILTALFVFLYFKPQFTNMPTTLFVVSLPEKQKKRSLELIRNVTVITSIWINTLFTFLALMIIHGSQEQQLGYEKWTLVSLVTVLLIWLICYNIYIYRTVKKDLKQ